LFSFIDIEDKELDTFLTVKNAFVSRRYSQFEIEPNYFKLGMMAKVPYNQDSRCTEKFRFETFELCKKRLDLFRI
jgi:hypothetical protein